MSDYYILITDAGAALEASAHVAGTTVKLAKFGVCDGGVDFIPDPAATTFANEVFQSDISSLTVSTDDATIMVAQCIIPGSSGGYTIRGIAIYTDDGTLYATGSYPAQPKPAPDSGFAASLEILAHLAVSDTADVSLTVTEGNFLTETQGDSLYLRQDKRLSEIADAGADAQTESRENIGCGTAATLDATTSTTDNTVGHALKVGDRSLGLTAINPTGIDFNAYQFAAGETLFLKMADCTNIPDGIDTGYVVYAYVNVIGVRNVNNNVGILIGDNGGSRYYWAVRSTDSSSVTTWAVRILPQSASDIDALPITGGDLTGPLNLHNRLNMYTGSNRDADGYGLIECYDANGVLAAAFGYYDDAFNLYFYDETGAYRVNALSIGSNANTTVKGNLSGVAVFEGSVRVYSPNNPPPATDLSGYQRANTASLSSNGWFKDTNTGLIIQWGAVAGGGSGVTATFPIAFPSACFNVVVANHRSGAADYAPSVKSFDALSVVFDADNSAGTLLWTATGH